MAKQIRKKFARNPENQKFLDIKYEAQNELEDILNWAITWKSCDCELFCERIADDNYKLSFCAGKGNYNFDACIEVEKRKMEFLMGRGFPVGEWHELYNNFKIIPNTKNKLGITKSLERERTTTVGFNTKNNLIVLPG